MKPDQINSELFLIDKPAGITSFDVIRILQKKYPGRKIGHAGTLDPFATGLLLVAVGDTERLSRLIGFDKTYEAEVLLGVRTATGDPTGKTVEEKPVPELDLAHIRREVQGLAGTLMLPVPAYSAVRVKGRRLYALVRGGKPMPALPIKPMEVRTAHVQSIERAGEHYHLHIKFEVGSGTYIRSVAEELGKRLGYPASLSALRRTRIGEYRVEDAMRVDVERMSS